MIEIGKAIVRVRKTLGLSQKQLLERCDNKISQSFLSQIERGERNLNLENLEVIAKNGLRIPPHLLVFIAQGDLKDESDEFSVLLHDTFDFLKTIYFKALLAREKQNQLRKLEDDKIKIQEEISNMKNLKSEFEELLKNKVELSSHELLN
ncbi:helix-turn-helix domain-containing protein [Flavilitoribacter nigricans]|uniref:HTH cro/C1-type domain-containing protein n=1 Tax=Flavilitoribacter nigricans (strain ATCC 23147 / DSM 23189 / NBRC 102662 / NCIMB 1420 / SS-2) TaxID=1122177 RepID=A0A2D0NA93_FLAN2|nr:helix-turn-helix domain-containing protein [Flavilitoribacter nigricans]PHN05405.1 hypothetical protein CRP01_15520 [Flavilitoribacter nigricans DSM 23189 = NBRC 102662]